MLTALFAVSSNGIVAPADFKEPLPWFGTNAGKKDLARFRAITMRADALIMGRRTRESIPAGLPYRRCLIISRTKHESRPGEEYFESVQSCIARIRTENLRRVYFIGGLNLLESMKPYISRYDITIIPEQYEGIRSEFLLKHADEKGDDAVTDNNFDVRNEKFFVRDEEQILRAIARAIRQPVQKDRTGVGSHQIFGRHMSFDLTGGRLPLITHRKTFLRGIFEELMWFIRGETDVRILQKKGVHIWDGNTSVESLAKAGLNYPPNTLAGPIYGWQWRNFGAEYKSKSSQNESGVIAMHHDMGQNATDKDKSGDQLGFIVHSIKTRATSRRLFMSAWNPQQQSEMCLPPCHISYQFHLEQDIADPEVYWLDCHYYQRSSDMVLALGWNIASAGLLTHMISWICGVRPRRLYGSYGNCHVYANHLNEAREIVGRPTHDPPVIKLKKIHSSENPITDLESIEWADLELHGYRCEPAIKLPLNS